jgi:hypothetical protein
MVLTEELGARIARDLHELVVDIRNPPGDIRRRHDGGVVQRPFQVRKLLHVVRQMAAGISR